ncbi:golgin subfamily A member 6-like protein 22 isoform X1 [Solea solea]|uniref:golgin subfamily A member 6-like protein 22 isoform X1 n=1 Tax=Solea solea TaxID=90069 RepID=UPI00272B3E47|nr:golgin subfamily A member 6-like protein 22 isoform X1 [Solea solea]
MHNIDAEAKMVSLRSELSTLLERRMDEREARVNQLTKELNGVKQEIKERDENVRCLNRDVAGLQASQENLQRTLALKEKHTQQLAQANTQLKETLTSLQSKLQTSESMLQDIGETLDQTRNGLSTETQQKQQIQDQEVIEHLQQKLTHVLRTTEKKMQRREVKISLLVKELAEHKKHHSDCQQELLQRDKDLEKLYQVRDELRAKMEVQSRECVHLNQTKERLEADLALSHEKLHISHLEVRSREQLILQLRDEMKTAEQTYQGTQEQVAALESEVRQLNHKVREHREEACQLSRKVSDAEHLKNQKETEQQQLQDQLCINQQQVEASEVNLKKQKDEIGLLHQQLKRAKEELKDARLQIQEQKETVAISKQKYAAAIEKVHKVQGQVELLEVELQFSQQQLRESQLEAQSLRREQAELEQRHREKVGQWERSQEAFDQLMDELQANQSLLTECQQKVDHFKSLSASLQEQGDVLKQEKRVLECDLRLHQQSHSHSDEEYFSLQRHRQQLQKRCTEQAERIAVCEKAILQMKSELERQTEENAVLKQSVAHSQRAHLSDRSQLEKEVTHLKNEVKRLELELADTQNIRVTLLRQSEEELEEARQEAARGSREADVQRAEVQRLQEKLQKEEEKMRSASREKQSLNACVRRLSQELDELHGKYQVTVEDLAARAEEVRRMEGSLSEGKQAEEKIRSVAMKLETEVAELRKSLQQAVNQKLKAERDKQDAQDQVDKLRSDLEGTRSDHANLRHESQLVMTNINHWITEQKAASEKLTAQMKAQNKLQLIVTKEKEHLQEANDTLKVEVKRLKEVADVKERDMERFKAHMRERGIWQDERAMENQTFVALNLGKIEQMQTRLRSNLEAIAMLNQQLNAVSGENTQLRRQLEVERSMRRGAEQRLPPPLNPQHCSSIHLPVSLAALPPPLSTSFPSSLRLPNPLGLDPARGHTNGSLTQTKLSRAVPEKPGESQALSEAFWMKPAAVSSVSTTLGDAWSGRTSEDLTK